MEKKAGDGMREGVGTRWEEEDGEEGGRSHGGCWGLPQVLGERVRPGPRWGTAGRRR